MSFVNEAHFSWSPRNAVFTDLRYIAASKRAADLTLTQMKKFFCQQIKINEKKIKKIPCKFYFFQNQTRRSSHLGKGG